MKTQWELFLAFFRVGMLGFGGGPAAIPLIEKEVVQKYKWMSDEDFGDILAIANTLPGPIATKLAGYVGYRVAGYIGMFNAVLITILPTILILIFIMVALTSFKDFDWVKGMTNGVVPVVGMMMAVLTWQFMKKSAKGFGWKKAIVLLIVFMILLEIFQVHPGILIATLLILALSKNDKGTGREGEAS